MSHFGREIDRMKASEKGQWMIYSLQERAHEAWVTVLRMGRRKNSQRAMSATNRTERQL